MKTGFRSLTFVLSMSIALTLAISALSWGGRANASGPPPVGLGTAASFAVLAGTPNVSSTGGTTITGDLGIHPAAAVTGFPPGVLNGALHTADAVALQAKNDLANAYNVAASQPVTATHGTLGGLTLVGGVYNAGGVVLDLTGSLALDGQGNSSSVWIFQATSSLVTASSSSVSFINGAQPCNVFWQVTSSATLGSDSTFAGTIMALDSITMANGVSMNGRALARNGLVSMINDHITRSTCAPVIVAAPRPAPEEMFTPTPTRTPTPAASPTTTPTAAPIAATATPVATSAPTASPTRAIQSLPSTATSDDNTLPFLILPIVIVLFVVLYLVARARRRARNPVVSDPVA